MAIAEEPPAKTAKDDSPDAKLREITAVLETELGHRTVGSKDAKGAVGHVEIESKRKELEKRMADIAPLLDEMKDVHKRAGARKKFDAHVKALIADMGDDDFATREAAYAILNDFSHFAEAALKECARKQGEDPEIRHRASSLIKQNRSVTQAQGKKLVECLKVLDRLPPQVLAKGMPTLMEVFDKAPTDGNRSPDTDLDRELKTLGIGMFAKLRAVPQLVEVLKNDDMWYVQDVALEAIGKIGPDAREATPVLKELFKAKHSSHPIGTVLAKTRAEEMNVPELLQELKTTDVWDRWATMLALAETAPKVKAASKDTRRQMLEAFIKGVGEDGDYDVRRESARGIDGLATNIGPKEERTMLKEMAVPALIEGLRFFNDTVKEASANALKSLGAHGEAALPALKELKDSATTPFVTIAADQAYTAIEKAVKAKGR